MAAIPQSETALPGLIAQAARPLPDPNDPDFATAFDHLGTARIVLLGEATHGTSEFYRARARITRRLIEEHGFTIVAVEADWPDAMRIDRHIRRRRGQPLQDDAFVRFPTWMWRNTDIRDVIDWLFTHNGDKPAERQVEFRGLDIYGLNASIKAVLDYLDRIDPAAAHLARERYGCLTPWQQKPAEYGRDAMLSGLAPCEAEVTRMLCDLLEKRVDYLAHDGEHFFETVQNARLIRAAEKYYRTLYHGTRESWNFRDRHMFETLQAVLSARGSGAKAVVWAHNSHIGNAAATEMGWSGELNIGQLCRQSYGEEAMLVGFGTDRGTVAAASDWGGEMEIKTVRASHPDSYEHLCRRAGHARFLLDLRDGKEVIERLRKPRLERAIGVIYRPETERWSHYFEADLPAQFDAWVWFEDTRAVTPLPTGRPHGVPETYPFGL